MYIQITDKCNMACDHCCFSCTKKGSFMSEEVFERALNIAKEYCTSITIGGGEPTLHPKCMEFVIKAASELVDFFIENESSPVWIITNGSNPTLSAYLAKLNHVGIVNAELSQDKYHRPIDPQTVKIFKKYASIKNVTGSDGENPVCNSGRAEENFEKGIITNIKEECPCPVVFIAPNGDFYGCGCRVKKLGNILINKIPSKYLFDNICYKDRTDI